MWPFSRNKQHDKRVSELLAHNNTQLDENRKQRRQIKALREAAEELLHNRSSSYLHAEDQQMLADALEAK